MSGKYADGVYNRRPWVAPTEAAMPPQEYLGPFKSNQERLIGQSLAAFSMTSEEIQQHVRPPLPQVKLFPPRYGYVEQEIGILISLNIAIDDKFYYISIDLNNQV